MSSILKWILPATAAFGLAVGSLALRAKAQDAPAAKKGSITGMVKDKDGKAAAGVEVRLQRGGRGRGGGGPGGGGPGGPPPPQNQIDPAQLQAQPGPGGGGQQGPPPPIMTATSDKDGKFEMKDVPVGMYSVVVRDEGKKLFGRAMVTVEADKAAHVDIACTDTPPQRRGGGGGGGGRGGGGAGGPPQQ
jgi:hypothetical protein